MPTVNVSDYTNLQAALNALANKVNEAHIMRDYRNQQSFTSASEIRRAKQKKRETQQKQRQTYRRKPKD